MGRTVASGGLAERYGEVADGYERLLDLEGISDDRRKVAQLSLGFAREAQRFFQRPALGGRMGDELSRIYGDRLPAEELLLDLMGGGIGQKYIGARGAPFNP